MSAAGTVAPALPRPAAVHRATAGEPVERVAWSPPPGEYDRLHLGITVAHGGWSRDNPSGTHNFLLARGRNRELFGYVNVRHHAERFLSHDIGQPKREKEAVCYRLEPGATYRVEYRYDTPAEEIELTVRRHGRTVAVLEGLPDLGVTGRNPNELRSLGWVWRHLQLESG